MASVGRIVASMQRLQEVRSEFDYVLTGHSKELDDAVLFDDLLQAAIDLDNGNTENDEEYSWFRGVCRAHPYGENKKIAYNEHTLK